MRDSRLTVAAGGGEACGGVGGGRGGDAHRSTEHNRHRTGELQVCEHHRVTDGDSAGTAENAG
jgi:hypothetical protein